MATSSQSGRLNDILSKKTTIVSLSLILGVAVILGFLIWISLTTRAIVILHASIILPRMHREPQKTVIKQNALDSFPIVKYSASLLNEYGRLVETNHFSHDIDPGTNKSPNNTRRTTRAQNKGDDCELLFGLPHEHNFPKGSHDTG